MSYLITNQKDIRKLFKKGNFNLDFKKRNGQYCTDTRCAFVDYIDYLNKSGLISDKLAQKATL